jgi:hypothetical protein
MREWLACLIDNQRTGIVHTPTWTFFRIEGKEAVFIRTAQIDGASPERIEELKELAVAAFPKVRWPRPRICRHPQI